MDAPREWTREDETAPTMPAPANEHDQVETWIDQFLATARDQDTCVAVLLEKDFAAMGDA